MAINTTETSPLGEMELIRGEVKVEWSNLNEGRNGDYNPTDPNDFELLRFDVSRLVAGEWEPVPDSSHCTGVAADTPREILERLLKALMDEFHDAVRDGHSIRKSADRMSWISPFDLEKTA